MNNLVTVNNGKATTTSLVIAEQFGRKHSHVLKSIEKVIGRYEIVPSAYIDDSGKSNKMYELPEREALIVMPFIGGQKSIEGQERLVDAFLALRNHVKIATPLEQRIERLENAILSSKRIKTELSRSIIHDDIKQRVLNIVYKSGCCGVKESKLSQCCTAYRKLPIDDKLFILQTLSAENSIRILENSSKKGGRPGKRIFII